VLRILGFRLAAVASRLATRAMCVLCNACRWVRVALAKAIEKAMEGAESRS